MKDKGLHQNENKKTQQLADVTHSDAHTELTTNQSVAVTDNQNTLKAGIRGPSLLEDFIFREKITHFDHERIPERVVHARGEGAHGYFEVYEDLSEYTKAHFLTHPKEKTPVFVRFSTVAGSRGSADTVRDVRGFATKFYTQEGVYDLVGNNMPVFFIQDAIKFPDIIHAVKPEPHHEMPQAQSAHDTFWDFISLMPESMHMVMWIMSDRAIPRSLRMMEGFGVNTFRLINEKGVSRFVKFHWKPKLGVHSLVWDEAQLIAGRDPDFHRRDLWEAIENGSYPEWELGLQIVEEAQAAQFDFDILDATKIIPEELVPVKRVGRLILNRNPDNFFAETEQVAFHPGHVVPGIDFSNDPLLQGRLFSYLDTQLSRLGGPNFHELPINRSICPFHNNQRDGMHRQTIVKGRVAYEPNSLQQNYPNEAPINVGFKSYGEPMESVKLRARSETMSDHFSQAIMFWESQADFERQHIKEAFQFELGKVDTPEIRERMVSLLKNVSLELARDVGKALGININTENLHVPKSSKLSPAVSMANTVKNSIATRQIAILAAPGIDAATIHALKKELTAQGAIVVVLADHLGELKDQKGKTLTIDFRLLAKPSVIFDAMIMCGDANYLNGVMQHPQMRVFLNEMERHKKR